MLEDHEEQVLQRIVINPGIFGGKPIIRGHRMSVSNVLGMMSDGATEQELLENYEWLEIEDIHACLLYASLMLDNQRVEPRFVGIGHAAPA